MRGSFHAVEHVVAAAMLILCASCGESRPGRFTIEGSISRGTEYLAKGDARAFYYLLDERARHAMSSIQQDRSEAARLIRETYPPSERAAALEALGDGARARDAVEVFTLRCDASCLEALAGKLSAPVRTVVHGREATVTTARGDVLHMYRSQGGVWGLAWHNAELEEERDQAARDIVQIRANAEVYRQRRALGDPW